MHGPTCISALIENLKAEDVQILLANRGLPSVGDKEDLADNLQASLCCQRRSQIQGEMGISVCIFHEYKVAG